LSTILLVDDEKDFLDSISPVIEAEFGNVATSLSAKGAFEILKSQTISCIITDYRMPEMTGDEFIEKLRSEGYQVPVIFFTGALNLDLALKALRLGVSDIIEKPALAEEMIQTIYRVLEIEKRRRQLLSDGALHDGQVNKTLGLLQVTNLRKHA
jgi:two-component system, LuxR family, response regulator FixJ